MTRDYDDEPLEPRFQKLLESLKPAPPRDPDAQARGRAKFLSEAESLGFPKSNSTFHRLFGWWVKRSQPVEEKAMTTPKQRFAFTALMIAGLALVLLFGGAGMTVYAAQSALPGDALYPFKTTLESTQASLVGDSAGQTAMHLKFAERRLDEISTLAGEKRFDAIGPTAGEFEKQIKNAADDLQLVSKNDPARAGQLAVQMSDTMTRGIQILNGIQASLPKGTLPAVQRVIQNTQNPSSVTNHDQEGEVDFQGTVEAITPDHWIVGGTTVIITTTTQIQQNIQMGSLVEVKAQAAADGSLTALSIRLEDAPAATEVNSNENDNENDNGNANLNENDNENDNENANLNSNLNANNNEDHQGDQDNQDHEVELKGQVDSISATQWSIAGKVLAVTPETEIGAGIQVGSLVEVSASTAADGSLTALHIKLENEDHSGGAIQPNSNDNGSHSGEDHGGNTNINSNQNENENGDHNGNTNSNENDDHSGETGQVVRLTVIS